MKSFSVLVVFFTFTLYLTVKGQNFDEIVRKCKTAEGATDADLANLKNNVKPKTKAVKCLGTCISENVGMIKDKKMNPEGILAYIKTLPINSDKVQQSVKEIMEECKGIQDPDRCEFGSKLCDCMSDGAVKRGINSLYPQ